MKRYPKWLMLHLFGGRSFDQLTTSEISSLRIRLAQFKHPQPDVTISIPVYNEEDTIFRTLSSLAANRTSFNIEIIVINNNSTDKSQAILDDLDVTSYRQPLQGIAFSRQMGLEKAKGKYHLCADADTLYPPEWIQQMVSAMENQKDVLCVYGRYSVLLPPGNSLILMKAYELATGLLFRLRKNKKEFINVLGFNMGFIAEMGRQVDGFNVPKSRKFDNAENSSDYTEISEDGYMAMKLASLGKLKLLTDPRVRVFTSARKILAEGTISKMFKKKIRMHVKQLFQIYFKRSSATE